VLIQDQGETAVFVGDLFPTAAHLPLPWIMGYDLEPLRTLESKRALLAEAVEGRWRIIFEHDPAIAMGLPVQEGKTIRLQEVAAAPEPAAHASG
jgi:glyoxylase-like metal-dependent hydrolase (beta-lactamase superfamily II)